MELNTIKAKPSKSKKRVGRGIGSGKGKTSGRGHKGQKSRSGVAIKSFEGGQMPLYRRLPKRGFKSMNNKKTFAIINLSIVQEILDSKKILNDSKINLETLKKIKRIGNKYTKLKLLGSGNIKEKLNFELNSISKSAKEKIEKLGGKVILIK
jgi:large subunit ribosomal protein L15